MFLYILLFLCNGLMTANIQVQNYLPSKIQLYSNVLCVI